MNISDQHPMEENSKNNNILGGGEVRLYLLTLLDSRQGQHIALFDILEKLIRVGYEYNDSIYILESQLDINSIKEGIQSYNQNNLFSYLLLDITDNINSTQFKASISKTIPAADTLAEAINIFRKEAPVSKDGVRIINQTEFEGLLDKISKQGILSITPGEKASMDLFSGKK